MTQTSYTRSVHLDGTVEQVEPEVREALSAEGFGVLTEIDMAATLKAKLDHDMPAYKVLGACSPPLAKQGLEADPLVGALLPCNVVLRQVDDDTVEVAIVDPGAMLQVASDALDPVAAEAARRIDRVLKALQPGG